MKNQFIAIFFTFLFSTCALAGLPKNYTAESLISSAPVTLSSQFQNQKAVVLVFLSAKCPCSDSHILLLNKMAQKYKNFRFVGIHSNSDESKEISKKYFKNSNLTFDVWADPNNQLADSLKAFKTPHAFIVNSAGEILYQGGVTNSSKASLADRQYLAEALQDITANKTVRTPEGRTLGCVILRERDLK